MGNCAALLYGAVEGSELLAAPLYTTAPPPRVLPPSQAVTLLGGPGVQRLLERRVLHLDFCPVILDCLQAVQFALHNSPTVMVEGSLEVTRPNLETEAMVEYVYIGSHLLLGVQHRLPRDAGQAVRRAGHLLQGPRGLDLAPALPTVPPQVRAAVQLGDRESVLQGGAGGPADLPQPLLHGVPAGRWGEAGVRPLARPR